MVLFLSCYLPVEALMQLDLVRSLFAIFVVIVSLLRLMSDHEYFRLTAMKKIWGRTRGLLFHFLVNVVLPLLAALYFLCRSITSHGLLSPLSPPF